MAQRASTIHTSSHLKGLAAICVVGNGRYQHFFFVDSDFERSGISETACDRYRSIRHSDIIAQQCHDTIMAGRYSVLPPINGLLRNLNFGASIFDCTLNAYQFVGEIDATHQYLFPRNSCVKRGFCRQFRCVGHGDKRTFRNELAKRMWLNGRSMARTRHCHILENTVYCGDGHSFAARVDQERNGRHRTRVRYIELCGKKIRWNIDTISDTEWNILYHPVFRRFGILVRPNYENRAITMNLVRSGHSKLG